MRQMQDTDDNRKLHSPEQGVWRTPDDAVERIACIGARPDPSGNRRNCRNSADAIGRIAPTHLQPICAITHEARSLLSFVAGGVLLDKILWRVLIPLADLAGVRFC